ncbi:MAG TPA: ABC transporter permease, partial [Chitinophagaceae bacterium]|nr:ABC transporter permease [Chitinophagaceae bacterium]
MSFKLFQSFRMLLHKQRSYFLANLLGLSIGMASCLIIYAITDFETSFDKFHKDSDRIYRVVSQFKDDNGIRLSKGSVYPLAKTLRSEVPGIEKAAAVFASLDDQNQVHIYPGDSLAAPKVFKEQAVFYCEPQFFEIFNFPFLAGHPATALNEPNSIVLSQAVAEKYFGDWQSCLGKTLVYRNSRVCKVTGVLKNPPVNTDFPIHVAISFNSLRNAGSDDWVSSNGNLNTFIRLSSAQTPAVIDQALVQLTKKNKPERYQEDIFFLQPLADIHSNSDFGNYNNHTFNKELEKALLLIGGFLLLIACVNFINLATAQAVRRSKEVGIKKVLGSSRKRLILQFLTETFLISILAATASVFIAVISLPYFNQVLETNAVIRFESGLVLFLAALALGVTLVSGVYPSIIISAFRPIAVLKVKFSPGSGG